MIPLRKTRWFRPANELRLCCAAETAGGLHSYCTTPGAGATS